MGNIEREPCEIVLDSDNLLREMLEFSNQFYVLIILVFNNVTRKLFISSTHIISSQDGFQIMGEQEM